jgi:integrase
MGRHAEGLKVAWRDGWGHARFTWKKKRYFLATGERDPVRAAEEAQRIYANIVSGRVRKVAAAVRANLPLDELFADWLSTLDGVLDPETIKTYRVTYVVAHFLPFFETFERIADAASIDAYARSRLRKVKRKTMQKELGAIRGFLRWARLEGFIDSLPEWPDLPRTSKGVRSGPQREKANELTEAQVRDAIMSMPILSDRISRADRRLFVVRPRFVLAYETGLRPATLDGLSVPEHWRPGSDVLVVPDELDKARFGRTLTLTPAARAALEVTCTALGIRSGLLFGRHDYRSYLAKAGVPGLAAYDFRHARGTHLVNRGAALSGVAYQLGHTQLTTTNKYAHATRTAGDAAIEVGGADLSGAIPDRGQKL